MSHASRSVARFAGVLFLATFVTAIPAVFLYDPVLNGTHDISGAGARLHVARHCDSPLSSSPEFLWELSLGIYVVANGFKRSPIVAGDSALSLAAVAR
jgi:hypothetical protein